MKHLLLPIAAVLFLASCKKTDDSSGNNSNGNSDPLVPENTGWVRVATIKYGGKYVDAGIVPNSMTAYDIAVNNGALQVLYSEDKFENGDLFSFYYKASAPAAGGSDPVVTEIKEFPRVAVHVDEESYRPQFRPGTYNLETFQFIHSYNSLGYTLNLYDEAANKLTGKAGLTQVSQTARMQPNGDILMGGVYSSAALEMLYYNRAANTWILNLQSNADTEYNIAYTPFMVDGDPAPLAFRLYSKQMKSYLSVAEFVQNSQYPEPPYSTRLREEHPEYAPTMMDGFKPVFSGTSSLVAYVTEGASLTAVLVNKNTASGAYTLSAYKWTKGATAFQKLYSSVSVSAELGAKLEGGVAGKCTPDGTVYVLIDANSPTNNSRAYHLSLTNAGGEKTYGNVYSTSTRYNAVVSTLHYINGAYYAAVTPMFTGTDYEGQHMDIVKLTP